MKRIGKIVREAGGKDKVVGYIFFCPGCEMGHAFNMEGGVLWKFNGDLHKPTLRPSYLTGSNDFKEHRCHSYITDGKIHFLGDCYHKLKGQTVSLPGWNKGDW